MPTFLGMPMGVVHESMARAIGISRIQFRRVGRQMRQSDIVRHNQPFAALMPTSAITDQQRMCAARHLRADFLQVLIHGFSVDRGHDDCRANAAFRADRPEQMRCVMAIVAHHGGSAAFLRPYIRERSLLADPGFVLEPDLDQ